MVRQCDTRPHADGELDERIVAFYQALQTRFPDHPPYEPDSPWMSRPLNVGIDHVSVHIGGGPRGDEAIRAIVDLANQHGLTIYDPQFDEITRPHADSSDTHGQG